VRWGNTVEGRGSSVERREQRLQLATRNRAKRVPATCNLQPATSSPCTEAPFSVVRLLFPSCAFPAFRRAERLQVAAQRSSPLVPRPRSPLAPLCGNPRKMSARVSAVKTRYCSMRSSLKPAFSSNAITPRSPSRCPAPIAKKNEVSGCARSFSAMRSAMISLRL